MVPDTYKNIDSLYNFKKAIKKWKPENCPCKICQIFIKNIRFCEIVYIYIQLTNKDRAIAKPTFQFNGYWIFE